MATIDCTLTTPEQKVFEGALTSIVVPAEDGELGILPGHASLVASLGFGELRIESEAGGRQKFFVDGGFVQVLGGHVTVLAASADDLSSIDEQVEKQKIADLGSDSPGLKASFEEKDAHSRSLAVAKSRLKLAQRV